jgi:hypothetical protein
VSTSYEIARIAAVIYLTSCVWLVVEAVTAPLLDGGAQGDLGPASANEKTTTSGSLRARLHGLRRGPGSA